MKKRIDLLLLERGMVDSRAKAQALILSGNVLVADVPVTKPGQLVSDELPLRIRGEDHPWVSRGGIKLAGALKEFQIPVKGRTALDVGASTGGFTHVLLANGIERVFAVDVGHNQLDWKIRSDERVSVYEKVNARHMTPDLIGRQVDLIVVDVSFISLEKIFPALMAFAHAETDWVTLIKPQFEVGKEKVGKGGLVSSDSDREDAVKRLTDFGETLGLRRLGLIESPITGATGNKEYLAHWRKA